MVVAAADYYPDGVAVIVAVVIAAFFSLSVALENVVADEGVCVGMAHFPVQIET